MDARALQVTVGRQVVDVVRAAAGGPLLPDATVIGSAHAGDRLVITLPAEARGVTLLATAASSVGTLTGSGSQTLQLELPEGVSAADIQAFLRGIRAVSTSQAYFGQFPVSLAVTASSQSARQLARDETTSEQSRLFNVKGDNALQLTVDPGQPTDAAQGRYQTLQEAVDAVAGAPGDQGRQGSRIVLAQAGAYSAAGSYNGQQVDTVRIGFRESDATAVEPDVEGLTIAGPNAGVSAGSRPQTRGDEAVLTGGVTVHAPGVTLDGFAITQGGTFAGNHGYGHGTYAVLVGSGAAHVTLQNMRLVGPGGYHGPEFFVGVGLFGQNGAATSGDQNYYATVSRSSIENWSYGVQGNNRLFSDFRGDEFKENDFLNNDSLGISLEGANGETITDNSFRNLVKPFTFNHPGYKIFDTASIFVNVPNGARETITGNSFNDQLTSIFVISQTPQDQVHIDATQNWWAGPNGPATYPAYPSVRLVTNSADSASDPQASFDVPTTPFLTEDPFPNR